MVTIKKFRGTKFYLMGNKDIGIDCSTNEDEQKPAKVKAKKRHTVNEMANREVKNEHKKQKLSPGDLMGKLEEFSDVWNDCPEIDNPKQVFSNNKSNKNHQNDYKATCSDFKRPSGKVKFENSIQEKDSFEGSRPETSISSYWRDKSIYKSSKVDSSEDVSSKGKGKQEPCISNKSDETRMKAVQKQIELNVNKKNIIKQALSSLDSGLSKGMNKKIIFDDDNDSWRDQSHDKTNNQSEKSNLSGKKPLFEEDGSDNETELKINSQFEGKKGQKLLELQSKFSSDSRFILDKRFAESGSEGEGETQEEKEHNSEKQKQFEILESIVGRPLKPRADVKKSTKPTQTLLLRFDPLREDHSRYIVKPPEQKEKREDNSKKNKKKKKQAKEDNLIQEEENRPEVNIERFYEIKDELKETLRKEKGQEFSLLKLFGQRDSEEPDSKSEQILSLKKQKHKTKSPFKYDSSDSETEERKETKGSQHSESKDDKSETQNKSISWYTSFFFVEGDPRFEEAAEFLKVPEKNKDDESEYIHTRRTLKDFLKRKYKNNLKNKGIFKKKLGGGKQGSFRKKRGNKS